MVYVIQKHKSQHPHHVKMSAWKPVSTEKDQSSQPSEVNVALLVTHQHADLFLSYEITTGLRANLTLEKHCFDIY